MNKKYNLDEEMTLDPEDEVFEGEFILDDSSIKTSEEVLDDALEKTELNQIALPYQIKENKPITEKQKALRAVNLEKTMKEKFNNPQTKWKRFLQPTIREKFLGYVKQSGSVTGALIKLRTLDKFDIGQGTVNHLIQRFPTFKDMVEEAKDEYRYVIEAEAHRRAVDGVDKDVYFQGTVVGKEKVYSDTLLSKLLEANIQKFRKASAGGSTNIKASGPIQVVIKRDF